jgi:hypothetical protein
MMALPEPHLGDSPTDTPHDIAHGLGATTTQKELT